MMQERFKQFQKQPVPATQGASSVRRSPARNARHGQIEEISVAIYTILKSIQSQCAYS
jgi:hypothetical protein